MSEQCANKTIGKIPIDLSCVCASKLRLRRLRWRRRRPPRPSAASKGASAPIVLAMDKTGAHCADYKRARALGARFCLVSANEMHNWIRLFAVAVGDERPPLAPLKCPLARAHCKSRAGSTLLHSAKLCTQSGGGGAQFSHQQLFPPNFPSASIVFFGVRVWRIHKTHTQFAADQNGYTFCIVCADCNEQKTNQPISGPNV